MIYDKSNRPPGSGAPAPEPKPKNDSGRGAVTGQDADSVTYPSLTCEGRIEVELPLRNCETTPVKVHKVQVRDLGHYFAKSVEAELAGNQAHIAFAHYAGCCKGQKLLSEHAQKRIDELSAAFAKIQPGERQEEFFEEEISPWLDSLTPGSRGQHGN